MMWRPLARLLNDGRGKVVPVLVVVFYLGMRLWCRAWMNYLGTSQPKCGNVPNAKERLSVPFLEGARTKP